MKLTWAIVGAALLAACSSAPPDPVTHADGSCELVLADGATYQNVAEELAQRVRQLPDGQRHAYHQRFNDICGRQFDAMFNRRLDDS